MLITEKVLLVKSWGKKRGGEKSDFGIFHFGTFLNHKRVLKCKKIGPEKYVKVVKDTKKLWYY